MGSVHAVQMPNLSVQDLVRAQVSDRPVVLPVNGALVARLRHITAVPSLSGQPGFSLSRLRTIDSVIERMAAAQRGVSQVDDPLEHTEQMIQMQAEAVERALERQPAGVDLNGLLFDISA